ncbi:MAG: hypothetical protein JWQ49_3297 [Edaphobacter sp.]|nr:hypothetical protein [Edaphobacter sp.]
MPSRRTPRTHTMVITSDGWTIKFLMRKAAPSPYTVNGKVTGGFVDIAHPAKYGDTGIKRFIINQDQVVSSRKILEKKPPPWQGKGRQSRTRRSRGIAANLRVSENKCEDEPAIRLTYAAIYRERKAVSAPGKRCGQLMPLPGKAALRGRNNSWGLPGAFAGPQDRRWIFLRPIGAHHQVNRVIGCGQPVGFLCFAGRVFLDVKRQRATGIFFHLRQH